MQVFSIFLKEKTHLRLCLSQLHQGISFPIRGQQLQSFDCNVSIGLMGHAGQYTETNKNKLMRYYNNPSSFYTHWILLLAKPGCSLVRTTGTCPISLRIARVLATTSCLVHGAGTTSTAGT